MRRSPTPPALAIPRRPPAPSGCRRWWSESYPLPSAYWKAGVRGTGGSSHGSDAKYRNQTPAVWAAWSRQDYEVGPYVRLDSDLQNRAPAKVAGSVLRVNRRVSAESPILRSGDVGQ